MSKVAPPFRADHVGSLLRPPAIHVARGRRAHGEIDDAELRGIEDTAIAEMIPKLEATGIQSITDGEFRREWFHLDFLAAARRGRPCRGRSSRAPTRRRRCT